MKNTTKTCKRFFSTILSSTEIRGVLVLRNAHIPSDLPTSRDGCGESERFDVNHALHCRKGSLVIVQHEETHDELKDLLAHVTNPSGIRCEHMVNPSPTHENGTKTHQPITSSSSDF